MTKVYGQSDNLIEIEGNIVGEVYGGDEPHYLIFSDATILHIHYDDMGVWRINPIRVGKLFEYITTCKDTDNEDNYSDIAVFNDGLKWVFSTENLEKVT